MRLAAFGIALVVVSTATAGQRSAIDAQTLLASDAWRAYRDRESMTLRTYEEGLKIHNEVASPEFAKLVETARSGSTPAACLLGRMGMTHQLSIAPLRNHRPTFYNWLTPPLVTADYSDTAKWLEQCGLGGDIDSFLNLAVFEASHRNFEAALVWTGVHTVLTSNLCKEVAWHRQSVIDTIYSEAKVARGSKGISDSGVLEGVKEYISKNLKNIVDGFRSGGVFSPTAIGYEVDAKLSYLVAEQAKVRLHNESGLMAKSFYSTILLELNGNGRVVTLIPFDALPGHSAWFYDDYANRTYKGTNPSSPENTHYAWVGLGVDPIKGKVFSVPDPGCR